MSLGTKKYMLSTSSAVIASLLSTAGVAAQDADVDEEFELETITVTARKKEENILKTPIAITAFSSERIERLNLRDIRDLPGFTPGFVFEAFAGIPGRFDSSPRFRGVDVNTVSPTRQTASIFVDGIFVANGIQGIPLAGVERVEIIKGPQSAFFGRNTFGGAVNYITKNPGEEFGGEINARIATRDDYQVNGAIEGPIIEDVLSARIGGNWSDKGGHYRNSLNGEELGRERTWSIDGTLFFTPSENFDAKIRVNYFENDDDQAAYSFSGVTEHNCGPFGGTDTTICGNVQLNQPGANTEQTDAFFEALDGLTALNGEHLDEFGLERQSLRISGQFDYTFPGTNIVLSSLTGYNEEDVDLLRDGDDTADNAFITFSGRQFREFSQEVRLTGTSFDEKLDWSVGANYFDQRFTNNGEFIVPPTFFAFGGGEPEEENIETFGVFGSLTYAFTDRLSLTFEGRYQSDKVQEEEDITDETEPPLKGTFKNFLPRAIINFQVTPETLLYASYSQGNLPGGFNGEVAALTAEQLTELRGIEPRVSDTFSEETLDNYEVGVKHALPDGRGSISAAAFFMERTGQTVRRSDLITDPDSTTGMDQIDYFINIGSSEIMGAEFEGTYQLTEMFTVDATLAYVDAEVKEFETGVFNEVFGTPDAAGQKAARFPKWSGSVSGMLEGDLSSDSTWYARADAIFQSKRFADELNLTSAEGGVQVNIRAGAEMENGVRIELFVTNLFDDDTPTAINRFRDLSFATPVFDFSTFGYQVGLRDRRQFGLRLNYDF